MDAAEMSGAVRKGAGVRSCRAAAVTGPMQTQVQLSGGAPKARK